MIHLHPAEFSDMKTAWELRRQIQPDLTYAEHCAWWDLEATSEHRFMAYEGPTMELVGILRVSHQGEIHILVTEMRRGTGVGTQMLKAIQPVAKALGFKRLWGAIDAENTASQRAFLAAGYAPTRVEVTL